MAEVVLFAGTTEGYELEQFLIRHNVNVCLCVATEYGMTSARHGESVQIRQGRLTAEEMTALMKEEDPVLVIDATHPYAQEVTKNIRTAAQNCGKESVRVIREARDSVLGEPGTDLSGREPDRVYVKSTREAAVYLKDTTGNVLVTTGSKELQEYTLIPDYAKRLYVRVIPSVDGIRRCNELGFSGKHVMAMQGPFSEEMNEILLTELSCRYLVTKDSGDAGGFYDKLNAAQRCGVTTVVIGRPAMEEGLTTMECRKLLTERLQLKSTPRISVIGAGMGMAATMTEDALHEIWQAELVIGSKRLTDSVSDPRIHTVYNEYDSEKIAAYIQEHPEYETIAILLSGDVGFYSGARKLLPLLPENTRVIPGISTVQYLMARLRLSWDDAVLCSIHGRATDLVGLIDRNQKVFALLSGAGDIRLLADKLLEYGMDSVMLHVGENLSSPEERICCGSPADMAQYEGGKLCALCAVNPNAKPEDRFYGLPDDAFIRGKVPMTKSEVRSVCLSKLRLRKDSVCYDIGAGTGSVSVEMARLAVDGRVYSVEKKEEAVQLLRENKKRFRTDNLEIISGEAPDALESLPAPSHAFIGGSSGSLSGIIELLLQKNPEIRIVITCITLETLTECTQILKEKDFQDTEIVQVGVTKAREAENYHLMQSENPVWIISFSGRGSTGAEEEVRSGAGA